MVGLGSGYMGDEVGPLGPGLSHGMALGQAVLA